MRHSAGNRRRFVLPMIILVIGGGIALFAAQRETERVEAMERLVSDLCLAASRGERLAPMLPTENALLRDPLEEAFRLACSDIDPRSDDLDVIIISGPRPDAHDDRLDASHRAIISVNDVDRLGLRLTTRGERIVIVGFWKPKQLDD